MINVILCGGTGTRLWPISRENYPKQFLKIFNNQSIFQQTVQRNNQLSDKFIIVSNDNQYFTALDQIQELNLKEKFLPSIIEPFGKNTAASIALAAFSVDKEKILFITPSDHLIENVDSYYEDILLAQKYAKENHIVTFGIEPTYPATGYGYIKTKKENNKVLEILQFKEKPNLETAEKYLSNAENLFLWNSGIFMIKADTYLKKLKKYSPEIYKKAQKAYLNSSKGEFIRISPKEMQEIPENSIDYAIMEKTSKEIVIKSDFRWKDVGDFDGLYNVLDKDENNNTKTDKMYQINSTNNFVFGKYKTIALSNVKDMIIVDTPTALLVAKKGEAQEVKTLVNLIKEKDPELVKFGRTVYKPWGKYTNLESRKDFKVKTLTINPNKRLSLQKHIHRSEHWTVVEGTALITKDDEEFLLRPNESTYIPIGVVHRISNIGKIPIVIVEIQVGEYLEEDDIIRIEDDFGRAK